MDLREFYACFGADSQAPLRRFGSQQLLLKYLSRLRDDPTFPALGRAMERGDCQQAFRAAHTIKGIALSLELPPVIQAASQLTEELRDRDQITPRARRLYDVLSAACRSVLDRLDLLES